MAWKVTEWLWNIYLKSTNLRALFLLKDAEISTETRIVHSHVLHLTYFTFLWGIMETWKEDFKWLEVRHWVKDKFNKEEIPDLKTVLFIIGIQELGHWPGELTKEVKQDLMHIATCTLLCIDGFYEFDGLDTEGWPHFKHKQQLPFKSVEEQEAFLVQKVIHYFHEQIHDHEEE